MREINKQIYTVEETAVALGIGRNSAYQGVKTGEIPSIKIGGRILVPTKALDNLLANSIEMPQKGI
jgi:excisionase family DNA binding protein